MLGAQNEALRRWAAMPKVSKSRRLMANAKSGRVEATAAVEQSLKWCMVMLINRNKVAVYSLYVVHRHHILKL